ncbi:MAG: M28 family peptidase [Polyangiaceae bacterium]|nr:M28 family peptidase [Polyangiaceae bacterium]
MSDAPGRGGRATVDRHGRIARTCLLALVTLGCGAAEAPRPVAASPAAPTSSARPAPASPRLAPLRADERALAAELRAEVHALAAIGERSVRKRWELAEAADRLALALEASGYAVERQGVEHDDVVLLNLTVLVPPSAPGARWLVVGAHYDSAEGSPGANDGATGAAALLALARRLRGASPTIGLRLALFAGSRGPLAGTPAMGSLVHARELQGRGERLVGMVALESLGYFDPSASAQRPLPGSPLALPPSGDFVVVAGDTASAELVSTVAGALLGQATLPIERATSDAAARWLERTDAWAFRQVGVPAVAISDGGALRDPHHGGPGDTAERLDYERLARTVAGLQRALLTIAGATPAD